jgi:catechol 2,3-dioxygenase-like lactoylglutathione lyase family enzyme
MTSNNEDRTPALRHVDLVVSSLDISLPFYRELLKPLGWTKEITIKGERGERLVYISGPKGFKDGAIGFRERQSKERTIPYNRYDLGIHHLAINAPTRKDVDKCANWLRKNNCNIESGPAEYYNDHYYAVFFYDPDGIKLELICGW